MFFRLRLAAAYFIGAFLWPMVLMFRAWTAVARVICALQTWSAEVLAEDHGQQLPAELREHAKVIPFRSSRTA